MTSNSRLLQLSLVFSTLAVFAVGCAAPTEGDEAIGDEASAVSDANTLKIDPKTHPKHLFQSEARVNICALEFTAGVKGEGEGEDIDIVDARCTWRDNPTVRIGGKPMVNELQITNLSAEGEHTLYPLNQALPRSISEAAAPILLHGHAIKYGSITCTSAVNGVTCLNATKDGFRSNNVGGQRRIFKHT